MWTKDGLYQRNTFEEIAEGFTSCATRFFSQFRRYRRRRCNFSQLGHHFRFRHRARRHLLAFRDSSSLRRRPRRFPTASHDGVVDILLQRLVDFVATVVDEDDILRRPNCFVIVFEGGERWKRARGQQFERGWVVSRVISSSLVWWRAHKSKFKLKPVTRSGIDFYWTWIIGCAYKSHYL